MARLFLTALVAAFLFATPASAAVCGPRDKFKAYLANKYGETVYAVGLVGTSTAMEFYVSESGTWSLVVTTPNRITCLIAAGDNFERLKPPLPGDAS